jgi:hypothetical protein
MGTDSKQHRWHPPGLIAAALFLAGATSIAGMLVNRNFTLWDTPLLFKIGFFFPLPGLLVASALVFARPRLAFITGIISGAVALAWMGWTERNGWNSWIIFNATDLSDPDMRGLSIVAGLRIVATMLTVMLVVYSALQLFPREWWSGKSILWTRLLPAATGLLVLAIWLVQSASPYRLPGVIDWNYPDIRILHVVKRGLFYSEVCAAIPDVDLWKGAYITRSERRLFQYQFGFEERAVAADDPSVWQRIYQLANTIAQSPGIWKLRTPPAKPLRSWKAEGWYVALLIRGHGVTRAFTTEYHTKPPHEVTDLFSFIEDQPTRPVMSGVIRDVCLGFCYDPHAALGPYLGH